MPIGSRLSVERTGEANSKSSVYDLSQQTNQRQPWTVSQRFYPSSFLHLQSFLQSSPDDCIIKSEAQDLEAKARNTGVAGLIPELPLAPGSPLPPGARGLFAGASNKRAEEGRTQICKVQQVFLSLASALPKQAEAASWVESAPGIGVALTQCVTPAKPQLTALSQLKYLKTYCTSNP